MCIEHIFTILFIVHDLKQLEDHMVLAQVYEKIYRSFNFQGHKKQYI